MQLLEWLSFILAGEYYIYMLTFSSMYFEYIYALYIYIMHAYLDYYL